MGRTDGATGGIPNRHRPIAHHLRVPDRHRAQHIRDRTFLPQVAATTPPIARRCGTLHPGYPRNHHIARTPGQRPRSLRHIGPHLRNPARNSTATMGIRPEDIPATPRERRIANPSQASHNRHTQEPRSPIASLGSCSRTARKVSPQISDHTGTAAMPASRRTPPAQAALPAAGQSRPTGPVRPDPDQNP